MQCPYNRKTETQCLQWTQDVNEDGIIERGQQVTRHEFGLMECLKENCGAWHNGRCHYASVNLDNE